MSHLGTVLPAICLYRSPSSGKKLFCDLIEDIMSEVCMKDNKTIVMGFHFDFARDDFYNTRLIKIMHNRELNQLKKKHTRITARIKTIIYLVFSNFSNVEAITLHSMIEIRRHGLRGLYLAKQLEKSFLTRNLKHFFDKNLFWMILMNKIWLNSDVCDVDTLVEIFYGNVQ